MLGVCEASTIACKYHLAAPAKRINALLRQAFNLCKSLVILQDGQLDRRGSGRAGQARLTRSR